MCPDEMGVAFKGGFNLPNRRMSCVLDDIEELGDLMDTKQRIGIENERDDNLTRSGHSTGEVLRVYVEV